MTLRHARLTVATFAMTVAAATAGCAPDPPSAIVGITVEGCPPGYGTGSGALIAPGLVLTSAHTLRGAQRIVVTTSTGVDADATIVAFDPELDLAYLATDAPGSALVVDSDDLEAGDRGRAWVVRDGRVEPVEVTVERRIELRTEDIYVEGETVRPGLELTAEIEPGDSGAPVVVDGRVVGVVWARSRYDDARAYAIDPDRGRATIDEQLDTGDLDDVDLARC